MLSRSMRRRLDIAGQLPPRGLARVGAIAALAIGGLIAVGLTALILVFAITALLR